MTAFLRGHFFQRSEGCKWKDQRYWSNENVYSRLSRQHCRQSKISSFIEPSWSKVLWFMMIHAWFRVQDPVQKPAGPSFHVKTPPSAPGPGVPQLLPMTSPGNPTPQKPRGRQRNRDPRIWLGLSRSRDNLKIKNTLFYCFKHSSKSTISIYLIQLHSYLDLPDM